MNTFAPRVYAQGLGRGAERGRDPDSPLPQLTSKDGAVISMGADVQFRVWDPVLSVMMVKDLIAATRMTAQNAMTKTLVKKSLREIQVEKLRIGEQLLVRTSPSPPQSRPSSPSPLGSWYGSNSKGKMELLKVRLATDLAKERSWENVVISGE